MKIFKKILIILAVIIAIAGIAMIAVKGFNYGILYSNTQRLNIYFENDFEIKDVEQIAKEVLGNNIIVRKGNLFGTVASITASEITDEQKENLITKLNEKYEIEIDKENDVVTMNVPQTNMYDIISSYITPSVIIFILVLVYSAVRFKKQGIVKSLLIPMLSTILVLAVYVGIYAIARIPVNDLFMVFAMLLFIATLIFNTMKLNATENK
mgnify:CR=1 FL=1